jgi:PAB-dependent poly(A)-specific ribonuclease subunit 2
VPAIVYLERTDMRGQLDFSMLPTHVDASILRRDTNIAR